MACWQKSGGIAFEKSSEGFSIFDKKCKVPEKGNDLIYKNGKNGRQIYRSSDFGRRCIRYECSDSCGDSQCDLQWIQSEGNLSGI